MNAPLVEESTVRVRLNEAIIQWIHLHLGHQVSISINYLCSCSQIVAINVFEF